MDGLNRRMILKERPIGAVRPTDVGLTRSPIPSPDAGEALVRVRFLSIDPTIRTWMNEGASYLPPIKLGEVVRSMGVGEVVSSETDAYGVGDFVFGPTGWQDFTLAGVGSTKMDVLPPGVAPEVALNLFGITGMTAYFGLTEIGNVQAGETVVVSGAAGATGSTVGQIAKLMAAHRVIGITGTEEKCRWIVDELGFDAAINYHSENVRSRLRDLCHDGIDVYFDNVGGDILEAALSNLALHARIVMCGAISTYNEGVRPIGPSNYINLITRRSRMEGFIILDYQDRYPEARQRIPRWVEDGLINTRVQVMDGLENALEALNILFHGGNMGKVVVRL